MKSKAINIGILGLGTVGCGVVKVIDENHRVISNKIGSPLNIKKIADINTSRFRLIKLSKDKLTTKAEEVIEDKDIDIIVEVIGGIGVAKRYVLSAIKQKKHIVTSNKELMAKFGDQVIEAAGKEKIEVRFEASCGGGIPIIRPLKQCLAANKIEEVIGIVNGTTNYILTRMSEEEKDLKEVLKEAIKEGYAEADPSLDIDGFDASYKIAILSSVAFQTRVNLSNVYREGIRGIEQKDIEYARELGYKIKLLAIARREKDKIEIRVHPTLVPLTHPLSNVHGAFNAIFVKGNAVGELMFYGQGAGALPTASAVVGDIIELAQRIKKGEVASIYTPLKRLKVKNIALIESRYYFRMKVLDQPGVLAKVSKILGEEKVSLASVVQKGSGGSLAEIVFLTYQVQNMKISRALSQIKRLKVVKEIGNIIRVEVEAGL